MTTGLVLDALVAGLLVVVIGYAALLSRRLSKLRDGRGELEKAIAAFGQASASAEASLQKLRRHADSDQSRLQESIETGRALRDELAFLLDRSEEQSKRFEDLIRSGRGQSGPSLVVDRDAAEEPAAPRSEPDIQPVEDRSEAESALLKTLAGLR